MRRKENEKATENLRKAPDSRRIADIIAERIAQKKREYADLAQQMLLETDQHPWPTVSEAKFYGAV